MSNQRLDRPTRSLYPELHMQLEILGSGTSHGIPVIGCQCPVCTSNDLRDNRMRASALFRDGDGTAILVDAGPEFRLQALRSKIARLDALLVTHAHADHIHGLDDIRIFTAHADMPVYANEAAIEDIRNRFDYIFKKTQEGGGKPHLELIPVKPGERLTVAGKTVTAIPLLHGSLPILGWRIGDTAYLTDCNGVPDEAWPLLEGTANIVIDALRARPHSTHFSFSGALEAIDRIRPNHAWFTHICHDFSHEAIIEWLKTNAQGKKIEPAHDGLCITVR
jgi:phosphoribosyl 1,2-cyclic phosphate phosphodiesterase